MLGALVQQTAGAPRIEPRRTVRFACGLVPKDHRHAVLDRRRRGEVLWQDQCVGDARARVLVQDVAPGDHRVRRTPVHEELEVVGGAHGRHLVEHPLVALERAEALQQHRHVLQCGSAHLVRGPGQAGVAAGRLAIAPVRDAAGTRAQADHNHRVQEYRLGGKVRVDLGGHERRQQQAPHHRGGVGVRLAVAQGPVVRAAHRLARRVRVLWDNHARALHRRCGPPHKLLHLRQEVATVNERASHGDHPQ